METCHSLTAGFLKIPRQNFVELATFQLYVSRASISTAGASVTASIWVLPI